MGGLLGVLEPCCTGECGDRQTEHTAGGPHPPNAFVVTLDKNVNSRLGLDVSPHTDGHLTIRAISAGCAEAWNQSAAQNQVMKAGDRILEVNGANSSKAMLERCKTEKVLRITVAPAIIEQPYAASSSQAAGGLAAAISPSAEADPALLVQMTEMGMDANQSRDALQNSGNDLQAAIGLVSGGAAPNPTSNDSDLAQLTAMGFDPAVARDALARNNGNVEAALAQLTDNSPPNPPAAPAAARPGGGAQAADVQSLVDMGFQEAAAIEALAGSNGDLQQAVAMLSGAGADAGPNPAIEELKAMGFAEDACRNALEACDGNLQRATNYLLSS